MSWISRTIEVLDDDDETFEDASKPPPSLSHDKLRSLVTKHRSRFDVFELSKTSLEQSTRAQSNDSSEHSATILPCPLDELGFTEASKVMSGHRTFVEGTANIDERKTGTSTLDLDVWFS